MKLAFALIVALQGKKSLHREQMYSLAEKKRINQLRKKGSFFNTNATLVLHLAQLRCAFTNSAVMTKIRIMPKSKYSTILHTYLHTCSHGHKHIMFQYHV